MDLIFDRCRSQMNVKCHCNAAILPQTGRRALGLERNVVSQASRLIRSVTILPADMLRDDQLLLRRLDSRCRK